jgi:hypothetical protein
MICVGLEVIMPAMAIRVVRHERASPVELLHIGTPANRGGLATGACDKRGNGAVVALKLGLNDYS